MARSRSPFSYRMIHALSPELIDFGVRTGMNCAVVATSGHKGGAVQDDPPVMFDQYPKYQPIRQQMRHLVESERVRVRGLIDQAHKAGMQALYHSYEPSLPYRFAEAYPEYYSPPIREFVRSGPREVRDYRELCIARPEVRAAITAKVEQVCRAFPDLDGYIYTNNESSSGTKVWHRCERCRDIPFAQTMKMLHDAMAEGIQRAGVPTRLFYRFWGANDTDEHYWQANKWRDELGISEIPAKSWMHAWVESHAAEGLTLKPWARDIPAFVKAIKGSDTVFVYKATWADTNLHHPLNPMLGKYKNHEQVCELSFEHCSAAPQNFYIMGREMQRRARLCRDRGVQGLCMVPIHWGENSLRATAYDPSKWSLSELNITLFQALVENPDVDLEKVTGQYLRQRYGKSLPGEVATLLLDTENIAHGSMCIRGIRATGRGLENFYYELIRYAPMFRGWQKKVYPSPANLKRIFRDKEQNVANAKAMCQRIEALRAKLPEPAYEELRLCFGYMLSNAMRYESAHKYSMMLWALREGTIKPTTGNLEALHDHVHQLLRMGLLRSANLLHE